jgi:hypothetical protein
MPHERGPGPPRPIVDVAEGATVYEAALRGTPSREWRAAFLRPSPGLLTPKYMPELARVDLIEDRIIFRASHGHLDGWLRRIDEWIAYANSVVEE